MLRNFLKKSGQHRRALRIGEHLRRYQKMEVTAQLSCALAHDLSNLLVAIRENCDSLLESDLPQHIDASVQRMRNAASQSLSFLNELLAFASGDSVRAELIDIDSVLKQVKRLLRIVLGTNVTFEMDLDASPSKIAVARTHLVQIVLNLILNSRDALPAGGEIVLRTRAFPISGEDARSSRLPAGDYVSLEVSDNGCGIDPSTGIHIFEPFFTTSQQGYRKGLGLTIVHQIVNLYGGQVQVSSVKGRGTRVRILFTEGHREAGHNSGEQATFDSRSTSRAAREIPLLWFFTGSMSH